jgi:hypothetical protein
MKQYSTVENVFLAKKIGGFGIEWTMLHIFFPRKAIATVKRP